MVDRYFAFVGQRTQPIISESSEPLSPAKEQFCRVETSQRLTIVFGFWNAPARSLLQIVKRINAQGSDVLLFDLNPNILYQQPACVRRSFEVLVNDATASAGRLIDTYRYTSIDLLGFSLGNVPLCVVAQKLQFRTATMVVPVSNIAICLWEGLRTQGLRNALVERNVTLETLQNEWRTLAPAHYANVFRSHHVTVYLAKKDKFIPYTYGLEFVSALEHQGVEPTVITSRITGHALTINNYIRSLRS